MLKSGSSENLVSLLSNDVDVLRDLVDEFWSTFDFNDRLIALSACSLLVLDGLLDHKQQFVAFYFIYSECKVDDIIDHPYYSVFKQASEIFLTTPNFFAPQVCLFVECALANVNLDFLEDEPIAKIYSYNFHFPKAPECKLSTNSTTEPKRNDILENSSILIENRDNSENENVLLNNDFLIQLLQEEQLCNVFQAPFIRPIPEISPIFKGEPALIKSTENPPFLYDEGIIVNTRSIAVDLMNRAFEKKLRNAESDTLINELKKDPSLIDEIELTKSQIRFLVENNAEAAKQIIGLLNEQKLKSSLSYIEEMEVSASSVDVVKHILMNLKNIPDSFTEKYIANATKSILSIKDHGTKIRKARIFSKMIGFIVQNGYELNNAAILDMNSFCDSPKIKDIKEAKEINQILFG